MDIVCCGENKKAVRQHQFATDSITAGLKDMCYCHSETVYSIFQRMWILQAESNVASGAEYNFPLCAYYILGGLNNLQKGF